MSVKVEPNQFYHSDGVWEPDEKQLKYIQKILGPLPFSTTIYVLISGVFGSVYSLKPKDTLVLKPEHVKRKDVIVHEFGHHIWHKLLDTKQQWAWRDLVDKVGSDVFKRDNSADRYNESFAHTVEYVWGGSTKRIKNREKAELLKSALLKILKRASEAGTKRHAVELQKYLRLMAKYAYRRGFLVKVLGEVNGLPIILLIREHPIKNAPSVLVSAGFHGDEVAGPLGIVYFLKHASPSLSKQVNISFLPLVSPSGFIQGTRLNQWGENPNRGYYPHINKFKEQALSREGVVLKPYLRILAVLAKDGLLSLHEDPESNSTYIYTYEKSPVPKQFSRVMKNAVEDFFVHYRDGKYPIGEIRDGIIYRECDGAFEDHLGHLGVPLVATSESPGQRNLGERLIAIEGILTSFIKYFTGAHVMKELTKELKKRGYKQLASKIRACIVRAQDEEQQQQQPPAEEDQTTKLQEAMIRLLKQNPNANDAEVHKLAEDMGVAPDVLEDATYKLLAKLVNGVGKHVDVPDDQYDPEQLKMGIEVEHEHTDNDALAKEIAKDHLSEGIPDYYSRLLKMENEAKTELKAKEQAGEKSEVSRELQ